MVKDPGVYRGWLGAKTWAEKGAQARRAQRENSNSRLKLGLRPANSNRFGFAVLIKPIVIVHYQLGVDLADEF